MSLIRIIRNIVLQQMITKKLILENKITIDERNTLIQLYIYYGIF